MFISLLFAVGVDAGNSGGGGGGFPGAPSIGLLPAEVGTLNSGSCSISGDLAEPASIRVSWQVVNPDDSKYESRVYQDGIYIGAVASSATFFDQVMIGLVEGGDFDQFRTNSLYRVDIVRLSDSAVVASCTAGPWQQIYGTCNGTRQI